MSHPIVSIIMPVYNADKYVQAAIDSVLHQTYTEWELIIIDDGSTDGSKKIIEKNAKNDSRIISLSQKNGKQASARNNGFRRAKGKWIAFLDADDIWLSEKLSIQLVEATETKADVLYTDGEIVDENLKFMMNYPTTYGLYTGNEMYNLLYQSNVVPILSVLVSSVWVNKVGQQNENISVTGCEDWDYWIKLAKSGANFYGSRRKLFQYRTNPDGTSRNLIRMQIAQNLVFINNFSSTLRRPNQVKANLRESVYPLINNLIKGNKNDEAIVLLSGMQKITDKLSNKLKLILVKILGVYSLYPIKAIVKINGIYRKMTKNAFE